MELASTKADLLSETNKVLELQGSNKTLNDTIADLTERLKIASEENAKNLATNDFS